MNSSVLCCATLNIAPGIERSTDSTFLRKLSANLLYQVFGFDVFGTKVVLWICSKGLLELVLIVSARDQLFFFCLDFLSRTFIIQRTAGKGQAIS